MLVNTLANTDQSIYENHRAFWAETVLKYKDSNSVNLFTFTPTRMSIDRARNEAAKMALQLECDYLLFIDDDVLVPMNTVEELIACDADIAAGLVIIRGYPFNVMAFKSDWTYFNELPTELDQSSGKDIQVLKKFVTQDDGLVGVGFSCCLIKCDLLKDIEPPWFITGPRNTEDVYFCQKAAETVKNIQKNEDSKYPDLKVVMNTFIQPDHLLSRHGVNWKNKDAYRKFYQEIEPNIDKKLEGEGRDLAYILSHLKGHGHV
jgi:hypothetical protein